MSETLPTIEPRAACLCCGVPRTQLPLDTPLFVGFGGVTVTRDGETVWSGGTDEAEDEGTWKRMGAEAIAGAPRYDALEPGVVKRLAHFERAAAEAPESDWRVRFDKPFSDEEYQRQGEGTWVLVRQGRGFA